MTKLEWYRENEPDMLKNVYDEDLLSVMRGARKSHCSVNLQDTELQVVLNS